MLLLGNPGSRAVVGAASSGDAMGPKFGMQSEHAAYQMLRVAKFFDVARLHKH